MNKFQGKTPRKDKMEGVKNWANTKLVPAMGKVGNQRHLTAIRDAFGTMIPLIIAGSIGLLIAAIIFGGAGSGKVSVLGLICKAATGWSWDTVQTFGASGDIQTPWSKASMIGSLMFSEMQAVTVGMMALYFAFLFGYFLGVGKNYKQPIMVGFASLAGFLIANMGQITFCMSAQGLISAIIFGIIASELFMWFGNMKRLEIKLPEGVPPAVGKSFAVFLPMAFTLGAIAIFNVVMLAPAIATTHWSVDAGQFKTINQGDLSSIWSLDISKIPTQFANYTSFITNDLKPNLNANHFASWFNGLDSEHQAVVATFLSTVAGYTSVESLASINSDAIIHFAFGSHNEILSMTFNYQTITVGSDAFGWGEAIFKFFTSWFISFATSGGGLGLAIAYSFFICFFWFFGVHGSNVMAAIFEPIWWMILGINASLYATLGWDGLMTGQMGTFGKPFFDSYMNIGGSGATLCLLIMVFVFSKRRELRELSKYATPPGIFQINEPVIFGFPIVLNVRYIAPFTIAPIINIIIGWVFVDQAVLGWVHPPIIASPWTAPWFVGAILSTLDPKALIPAFISFFIDLLIFAPFILLDNHLHFKKMKVEDPEGYEAAMRFIKDPIFRFETKTEEKMSSLSDEIDTYALKLKRSDNEKLKVTYQNKIEKLTKRQTALTAANQAKLAKLQAKYATKK